VVDDPDCLEERVHDAVVAEQDDPRVGPDQVARPERQHHEDDQQDLVAAAVAADPVGDRVADRERQDRRDRREPDRVQEGGDEDRAERPSVVVEAGVGERDPVQLVTGPQADDEDERQRDDEETGRASPPPAGSGRRRGSGPGDPVRRSTTRRRRPRTRALEGPARRSGRAGLRRRAQPAELLPALQVLIPDALVEAQQLL
jgi:hypothetical protein